MDEEMLYIPEFRDDELFESGLNLFDAKEQGGVFQEGLVNPRYCGRAYKSVPYWQQY
jgi:hypothetical protein